MKREKVPSFELMLWRFCRGNVFHRTADLNELIEDPQSVRLQSMFEFLKYLFTLPNWFDVSFCCYKGSLEAKTVFIIFFQGEQLKNKCRKICDG